jgi:hypothetical protein
MVWLLPHHSNCWDTAGSRGAAHHSNCWDTAGSRGAGVADASWASRCIQLLSLLGVAVVWLVRTPGLGVQATFELPPAHDAHLGLLWPQQCFGKQTNTPCKHSAYIFEGCDCIVTDAAVRLHRTLERDGMWLSGSSCKSHWFSLQ